MPAGCEGPDGRLQRERAFHDSLASTLDPLAMAPGQLGPLEMAMFEAGRITPGAKVLDVGCGSGDLIIHLLSLGADVTGIDISPGMLALAEERVRIFGGGRTAELRATSAERMELDSAAYDVVVGRFILHHLEIGRAAPEVARVLRPGGRAVFAENSARNPILMVARRHVAGRFGVPRLGTEDEHPLAQADIAALAAHFADVRLTYPVFEFFRIFDRQVLRFRWHRATRVLRAMDRGAGRIRRIRPYSFRVLVTATAG
jgi:ubiquinone/menaquinone biosynthesis C-methylase UbiE